MSMGRYLVSLLGCATILGMAACPSAQAEVIVSEIMYNPAGTDMDAAATPPYNREWVELYNTGSLAIDLSGWQLGDSQDGDWASAFAPGLTIEPHQALVVTGDAATFDAQWGTGLNRVQVANFPLLANTPSPTNETIAIRDNLSRIRDEVNFDAANGWPRVTGSIGASIFALPSGLGSSTNNLGSNWKPSMWGVYGGRFTNVGGDNHASPGFVDAVPQTAFVPSPDAAWSMVVLPDTQNYVKSTADLPILHQMLDWILDNKEAFGIQAVLQEGDIVNQNSQESPTSGNQSADQQWENARNAFSVLNGKLPYIMAAGNHDLGTTSAQNRTTQLNDYFHAADNPLVDPVQGGILQGTMEPGALENAYYAFTAPDGRKMLIFSLEFGPRQAVVDWAHEVATRPEYADYTATLLTHAYMNHNEQRYDWTKSHDGGNPHAYPISADTNDGEELWNELIKLGGNFKMTLNGHVGGDGVAYLASVGDEGNTVHQMLFNSQFETFGGDGWLRVLEFLDDGVTVRVRTYSPYHDLYRTDAANDFEFQLATFPTGDFNRDGRVDAADYTVWRDQMGMTGAGLAADVNHDNVVNQRDYAVWKNHFGETALGGSGSAEFATNVPEPASAALSLVAWLLLVAIGPLTRRR